MTIFEIIAFTYTGITVIVYIIDMTIKARRKREITDELHKSAKVFVKRYSGPTDDF